MKIFVTGATGLIGFAVAGALRRAGHDVYGLIRNEEKMRMLRKEEIIPVQGDLEEPDSYRKVAEDCQVLVHTAFDSKADAPAIDKKTVDALLASALHGANPKTVVFTSGVWVLGNTGFACADESTPVNPARRVVWRPAHEQLVLNSNHVNGIVVRPGCVYGRSGSMTADWFAGAYKDRSLKVIGNGNNRWAMVHIDDLARGYVRVVESNLENGIIHFVDRSRNTIREMAEAVARATKYQGEIEYIPVEQASRTMGSYAECLALDQYVDSGKAARLLDWHPSHPSFVDGIDTYFESWKAFTS